ncbi:hypothetical protein [Nocardia puris]|uniref:UsfY protein n=1 Tax=Nocardia puris TaxID=208602 RepID=A0A366DZ70_9NOCA|nr:hypothetical protein [Nocardia puris]RBO94508.1 hypothetical protein DFR74_102931 [Nocardia puris]
MYDRTGDDLPGTPEEPPTPDRYVHPPHGDSRFPDDARTTRAHAGEALEDGYNVPGIVLCAVGVIALALALTAAGYGYAGWAIIAGVAAAAGLIVGATWILLEHRRVKSREGLYLHDQRGH